MVRRQATLILGCLLLALCLCCEGESGAGSSSSEKPPTSGEAQNGSPLPSKPAPQGPHTRDVAMKALEAKKSQKIFESKEEAIVFFCAGEPESTSIQGIETEFMWVHWNCADGSARVALNMQGDRFSFRQFVAYSPSAELKMDEMRIVHVDGERPTPFPQ